MIRYLVRSEVLMATIMKVDVFWDVASCIILMIEVQYNPGYPSPNKTRFLVIRGELKIVHK
jgi:hypothetical protein